LADHGSHQPLTARDPHCDVTYAKEIHVVNEPTWIESTSGPLFAWISRPLGGDVRGGVVLAQPVGFEARGARRALRNLARALAARGYVALRFDYTGTGDSVGDFGQALPDPQWLEDVASTVRFLRSAQVTSVSAVGMRLGALAASVAASRFDLDLSALVLWDPCESGRGFLRELRALESLRRESFYDRDGGSVETAEYLFPGDVAESLRSLNMIDANPANLAGRTLVLTRSQRPISSRLRQHLEQTNVDFDTTEEQEALLDIHPFYASIPHATITRIADWIVQNGDEVVSASSMVLQPQAITSPPGSSVAVRERALYVGPRGLFALISEPEQGGEGPWVVMYGGIHEDHTGPSRLWVELSRRWAASGLRCVRVDVTGMGESPRPQGEPPVQAFDPIWVNDVSTLSSALDRDDPTNLVFIGTCSGAFLAIESAFAARSRGLCIVNPPIGTDYIHALIRLQASESSIARLLARPMRKLLETHHWIATLLWQTLRPLLPRRWSTDVMKQIVANGADIYVLGSADDLSPYPNIPILRSIEGRHIGAVKPYPFILVPDLDHDLAFAVGRERTVSLLEAHVRSRFSSNASITTSREDQ
jgi:dienelactone hydrolase